MDKDHTGTVRINVVLDREFAEKLRGAIYEAKGMRKGNISEAMKEAAEMWMEHRHGAINTHTRKS